MTGRLHPDEVPIDRRLVERLLAEQLPRFAQLPVRLAPAQGSDNVVFRLGDDLAVRLPRKPSAVPGLLRERDWLPRIGPLLPLAVPTPIAAGEPSEDYPLPWLLCTWIQGRPVAPLGLDAAGARALGEFAAALHAVDASGGPIVEPGQRGGPLAALDRFVWPALEQVERLQHAGRIESGLLDRPSVERVWSDALAAPVWAGPAVWLHRDLLGANLLADSSRVHQDRLVAVIDFGGLVLGDPAADAMGAFHVVAAANRSDFAAAAGIDAPTWSRGRGIALLQGLQALPYYLDTHPGMVAMARNVIASALADRTAL